MFKVPEEYRVQHPRMPRTAPGDLFGLFVIPLHNRKKNGLHIRVLASSDIGWEHVSVSLNRERCPTWDEMCKVKDLFWSDEATVIQYHPAAKDYVNHHPYCLHLWRPNDGSEIVTPAGILVGWDKKEGDDADAE